MNEKQIAKAEQHNPGSLKVQLENMIPEFERAAAGRLDPVQFSRVCQTHYQRGGDAMRKADFRSFIAACVMAAQLGLQPDNHLGDCYLIPRWDKDAGMNLVNLQIGYQGLIKLARRGGVIDITADVVHENDVFNVVLGTNRKLLHVPWYCADHNPTEAGPVTHAYATAKLKTGDIAFRVVTKQEIDAAKAASGGKSGPSHVWRSCYDEMAKKTAIRRLCKLLPMPDEARRVLAREDMYDSQESSDAETIEVEQVEVIK